MDTLENYYGRWFVEEQLTTELRAQAEKLPAFRREGSQLFCQRCGSLIDKETCLLPNGAYYCRECILLGRIRSDQALYAFPAKVFPKEQVFNWQGQLTPYQAMVSKQLVEAVKRRENSLVHAVTGAGKTEMIYQVVASVIAQGGAVCLASPRIDVCLELHRRLQADFSCSISLLHGESDEYVRSPLVIATTHQLLKFYHAFDLLIIDEVDAFPYVDNPMLYQAVEQSLKPDGVKIFLTATSTDELDKQIKQKRLKRLSLPRRFHGNPLIVPKKVWLSSFKEKLEKEKLPDRLVSMITKQRQTAYPLLIFVPEIDRGEKLAKVLQTYFSKEPIAFVSSQTENRLELVEGFRKKEISILISTTILERGVTFPCVDVFVLEANHFLFTKSSLVQIAGRVGRSMERPEGLLYFFHNGTTRAIENSIAEIKAMNKEAGLG